MRKEIIKDDIVGHVIIYYIDTFNIKNGRNKIMRGPFNVM